MSRLCSTGALLRSVVAGAALSGCHGGSASECLALPCPLPLALTITVTSAAAGAPVSGAIVQFSGPMIGSAPCSGTAPTMCRVSGYAGTYRLEVGAPGFQIAKRSVTVDGTRPDCGCPTTVTAHIDVELVEAP